MLAARPERISPTIEVEAHAHAFGSVHGDNFVVGLEGVYEDAKHLYVVRASEQPSSIPRKPKLREPLRTCVHLPSYLYQTACIRDASKLQLAARVHSWNPNSPCVCRHLCAPEALIRCLVSFPKPYFVASVHPLNPELPVCLHSRKPIMFPDCLHSRKPQLQLFILLISKLSMFVPTSLLVCNPETLASCWCACTLRTKIPLAFQSISERTT